MKFFVISDTHGKIDKVLTIYEKLTGLDGIIHLGDVAGDVRRLAQATGREIISVSGNNDGFFGRDDFHILDTEYGKILLTHGHRQHVKSGLQKLKYRTMELECRAVLFGHTHLPVFTESTGIYFVNPGSLTYPADGSGGSYAIVNTSKDEFSASIVYYQNVM